MTMDFEQFAGRAVELVLADKDSQSESNDKTEILSLKLSELEIDSLYFMEIVIEIEDMIGVQATDKELSGDPTLEDFLKRIYENKD